MALSKSMLGFTSFTQICRCFSNAESYSIHKKLFSDTTRNLICLSNKNIPRKLNSNSRSVTTANGAQNSINIPRIINKDRMILLGLGVIVVGCLVGWEKKNIQTRKHKQLIKKLHTVVLTAQNSVKAGKYEEAVKHYTEARMLVDRVVMSSATVQNKVILNIVDQLGHLAYELENWEEADVFLKETQNIMLESNISKDDDVYIEVTLRLATVDTMFKRKTEALDRFTFCIKSLENKISVQDMYQAECPERVTLYGMVLTEYATYARELGLLDESEEAFSKALNVCRNVLGPTHEQTSVLANDLATVYDEKGRYNKAIRLAEKAIKIASETAPENLATYKYNLGHILMHKGDLGKARKSLREALQLAEENDDSQTKELIESSMIKLDI